VPGWVSVGSLALCTAGLAVSGYLTLVHYTTHVQLACSATGTIDCQKVTTSPQSMVGGIPVALLGVIFFALGVLLCLPRAWGSRSRGVRVVRIGWVVGGAAMVVRLVYAELFQIDAVCLWCSAVHVITVALFATVLVGEAVAAEDAGRGLSPARR